MTDRHRAEFDATLDDVVDVNMRMAGRTATYRQQRARSQRAVGVTVVVVCVGIVVIRGHTGPAALALASGVGVVSGLLLAAYYGHFHDGYVRDHYQRMVREIYGGAEQIRCEFELRPDVLWTRTRDVELSLPWSRLKQVNDTDGSIELWFDPGLAVIRDRAFRGDVEHRREFLEAARRLGAKKAV